MTVESCLVTFSEPYEFRVLLRDVERLIETFPFLHRHTIGRSVMGKPLLGLRLGTGERMLFVNGAFHANEWITAPLALRFVEELARALQEGKPYRGTDLRELFRSVTLWTVPMVNPDGVDLSIRGAGPEHPHRDSLLAWNGGSGDFTQWKANIRGVDLNDQFPAFWETERDRRDVGGPGPRDYTGEAPLTEPEAAAVAAFTEEHDFSAVIALHTQGREIYWNYRGMEPPEAESLAEKMALASGYKAVKLTGSDAGYKDWFIYRWGRPGFTVEAGLGANPLPLGQFPSMVEETSAILWEALLASVSIS